MKNKHELRREASTRAMIEAASEIVTEGGFDALTLAAIGDRSGYSRGLVTARFGSKDGLLEALIDHIAFAWQDRTLRPMLQRRNGLEAALGLLPGVWKQVERDDTGLRALYTIIFEAVSGDALLHNRMAEFHQTLRNTVTMSFDRGIADGSVKPDVDPSIEAGLLVATLRGVGFQWMLDSKVEPAPMLRRAYYDIAVRVGTKKAATAAIREWTPALAS